MSVIIQKEASLLFSSDPAIGAENVTNNGSSFSVTLNNPLYIPKGAVNCMVAVNTAAIWYVNYNISTQLRNNQFKFTTTAAPAGTHTVIISDGLYSLSALSTTISNLIINLGYAASMFFFSGDDATQQTIITFSNVNDSIDFTIPNSLRFILGFNSAVYTAPSKNYSLYSPNIAAFNTDNSYIISSDLTPMGIPINNQDQGILVNVPITSPPGSQIIYQPNNLVWSDASNLIGHPKQNIRFKLMNQNLIPINTVGETWQFTLVIQYSLLLTEAKFPLVP